MASNVIVVVGATGQQGGAVAKALLAGGKFKVRGLTRNTESGKSKALAALGAEMVACNLEDKAGLEKALAGAYGVFIVTNYWLILDMDKETQQGMNVLEAAKKAGVKHLIYSGLENVKEVIGKPCPHFDSKAVVEAAVKASGVPYTIVRYSLFGENFLTDMKANKIDDSTYALVVPMGDVPMDMLFVPQAGECVAEIFNRGTEYQGKTIGLSSARMTVQEYVDIFNKVLGGPKIIDPKITCEAYAGLGFPAAQEFANMFEFYQVGKPERDEALSRKLNPKMETFQQWVESNKEAFKAAWFK